MDDELGEEDVGLAKVVTSSSWGAMLPPPQGDSYSKPQIALVMFPKVGKMNAVSRKIFNVLAKSMQEQVAEFRKQHGRDLSQKEEFTMPLRQLLDGIEPENSNLFQQAKARLTAMNAVSLEYESPTKSGEKKDWGVMSLVSNAGIRHDSAGVPHAHWQYPGPIYSALTESGLYTSLNNALIATLKTYGSIALYEICVKFKSNPGGVTAPKSVEWWVDALSETPPKIDKKTGLAKGRNWAHFKDRQLRLALEEVNSKTDISVDLIEHKTGKKITHAQFSVKRKSRPEIDTTIEINQELKDATSKARIREADVLTLIKLGNSEALILDCMAKLQARLDQTDLPHITSRIGYLRTIVLEKGGLVQQKTKVDIKPIVSGLQGKPATRYELGAQVLGPASSKPLPLAKTYREERFEDIKQELLDQPKEAQREIANRAYSQMPPLLGKTVLRKLQAGEWASSAPLIVKMVDIFAVQTHGPNWDAEQQSKN